MMRQSQTVRGGPRHDMLNDCGCFPSIRDRNAVDSRRGTVDGLRLSSGRSGSVPSATLAEAVAPSPTQPASLPHGPGGGSARVG